MNRKRWLGVLMLSVTLLLAGCLGSTLNPNVTKHAQVSGVVTDDNDDPVEGATITIGSQVATTDADGAYQFDRVAYGNYTLAVLVEEDGEDVVVESVEVEVNEVEIVRNFTIAALLKTQQVSGSALWDDGPALVGVTLSIAGNEVEIDASGEYLFEHVLEGTHTLTATENGQVLYEESVTIDGADVVHDIVIPFPRTELRNGGFELWPAGFTEADALEREPFAWKAADGHKFSIADIRLTDEMARSGNYSYKVEITEKEPDNPGVSMSAMILSRPIKVTPGNTYTFTAYVYNVQEGVHQDAIDYYLEFWTPGSWASDDTNWDVDAWDKQKTINRITGGRNPDVRPWTKSEKFGEWEKVTLSGVAPEGVGWVTIGFWTWSKTLKTYIDDVELVVTAPN